MKKRDEQELLNAAWQAIEALNTGSHSDYVEMRIKAKQILAAAIAKAEGKSVEADSGSVKMRAKRVVRSKKPQRVKVSRPMGISDDVIAIFDNALNAAEVELQGLLSTMSPHSIVEKFRTHLDIHLKVELSGARKYDNDCEVFREAVNEGRESAF